MRCMTLLFAIGGRAMRDSRTMRMHFLMHDEVVRVEMVVGPA